MAEKEFNVNDYITLKLEGNDIIIYVEGESFRLCRIDEAAKIYKSSSLTDNLVDNSSEVFSENEFIASIRILIQAKRGVGY